MTTLREGSLEFRFCDNCLASKYDDWAFYRNQFQSVAKASKAVDIVCVEKDKSWLIEIKDYRKHPRSKAVDTDQELAAKVRDTLAGLAAAAKNADDDSERKLAKKALAGNRRWRVVLHLEQPSTPSRLWPKAIDPANLLKRLRSKNLKAVDAHPVICDRSTPPRGAPWTVE